MQFLEYPYVIITILAMCFVFVGVVGAYFTIKSVKTANGTVEKSFCGIGKIENSFEKAGSMRKERCLVYISVSLDSTQRLYSEAKSVKILENIRKTVFSHFCVNINGEISLYGKNNFVALSNCGTDKITVCINKCYEEINKIFVSYEAVNIAHVNFGVYCTCATDVVFKTALERAKQACTIAENEETLYCQWDSSNGKDFERKIKIENNIQNEIENNRFFLEYQPILDAKTNKIVGAEVLSRLNSLADGILTPRTFLSAVNNVGLNEKFDYYIFEKNCKWIANDKENRTNYLYAINFSRTTLCSERFTETIVEIIEKYELDYSCVAIEILEDKNLTKDERGILTENLIKLKGKGIKVLLDDFGHGYTSFGDLTEFNISVVKIDKSITQNAITEAGFVILKNIIRTAHDLGFKTLCEGIETQQHKETAIEAGCDMFQGYYLYRPMPVAQLEDLLKDN